GYPGDFALHQIAKFRTELRPRMGIVVGDVFDVRTDQLLRSHAAKGHRWIWIIDFDHPADLSGDGRIPAQHRGLQRDNDIDVFRLIGDEDRAVRAQTVADDDGARARRLALEVVDQGRPILMQIGADFHIRHQFELGYELNEPNCWKRSEHRPQDADK